MERSHRRAAVALLALGACAPQVSVPPDAARTSSETAPTEVFVTLDGHRWRGEFAYLTAVSIDDDAYWLCFREKAGFPFPGADVRLHGPFGEVASKASHETAMPCIVENHVVFEIDAAAAREVARQTGVVMGWRTLAPSLVTEVGLSKERAAAGDWITASASVCNVGESPCEARFLAFDGGPRPVVELSVSPPLPRRIDPEAVARECAFRAAELLPNEQFEAHGPLSEWFALDRPGRYEITIGFDLYFEANTAWFAAGTACPVSASRQRARIRGTVPLVIE
jgi:hypothetical protein